VADLEVKDLTVEYSSGGYVVRPIDRLSVSAPTGQLVLLLGPSGCGKTTLLSCLAGILSPTDGSIMVGDRAVNRLTGPALTEYRRHGVGIVFQAFNLIASLSALENVEAPMRLAGTKRREAKDRASALIARVGLEDRGHHKPGQLSGGQQQRVAIARALVHDPPVLLADEPTAHLDYIQVESVLQLLRELAAPGRVVVVATHDERMIPLADQVVELAPKFREVREPERVELEPGQVLFEQGDRGALVYVVDSGEIEIYKIRGDRSEERVVVRRAGEHFGELGPLLGLPRSASARAIGPTVVTGYSVGDFRDRFGGDIEVGAALQNDPV
jgi:putative ABC transport system ATP-binding protein